MKRWWLFVVLLAGSVASLVLFWLTDWPLGVPEEWIWQRNAFPTDQFTETLFALLVVVATLAVFFSVCLLGANRFRKCNRTERGFWLLTVMAAGSIWMSQVQDAPPAEAKRQKVPWVLYYPGSSGYFYKARYEMNAVPDFLAKYETLMEEGDVLHVGTHPPGLFLWHRWLWTVCHRSPNLTRWLIDTEPASVRVAFETIEANTKLSGRPLTPTDRAAIRLAGILTQWITVLTMLPLYLLLRLRFAAVTSFRTVSLWPLIPALAVFQPKSDLLYPFIGTLFLWLWLRALQRRSLLSAFACGLVFWVGMFCSLALLPMGLLAACLSLWQLRPVNESASVLRLKQLVLLTSAATLGLLLPILLCWWKFDLNLFVIWSWNYHNHAGFYDQFERSYFAWLLVNPWELCCGLGFPIALLSLLAVCSPQITTEQQRNGITIWSVWAILWLTGKNMGEAARLWIVIMPWFVWLCASWFDGKDETSARRWFGVMGLQAVIAIATILRVSGFHF